MSSYKRMKIASIVTIFALLFNFFSFLVFSVNAQSNATEDRITSCLKNRVDPATGQKIPDSFNLTWHDPPSPQSLKKYLTGTFHPVTDVYAIACKGTDAGRTCSTGNKTNDDYLFFSDLEIQNSTGQTVVINQGTAANTDLTQLINVKFYVPGTSTEGSKATSDSIGTVNYDAVIYGTTADSGGYSFYGIQIVKKNNVDVGVFDEGGQQQGTFEFEFPDTSGTDCASISWTHHDPYGIVFDAKSLEPLSGVTVTILDKDGKKVSYDGFVNDQKTGPDGVFNYAVQAGTYTLVLTPPANYKFESSPPLNSNAERVYVFQDTNGSFCSLYKPGEAINEIIDTPMEVIKKSPDPECRNVPLTPLGAPYVADQVVSIFYDINKDNLVYTFKGKVSHPLTLVSVMQDGQQLGSQKANNSGHYTVSVPVSSISQTAPLEVVFTKANLTGDFAWLIKRFFGFDVNAATILSKITVDPMPSYIEGYAYDTQKQVIPNAVVKLRLRKTGGVYYETKADEKGYFVVSPSNIPTMEYQLEFINPVTGKKSTQRTYQFAKNNSEYLKTNRINLITATKDGKSLIAEDNKKEAEAAIAAQKESAAQKLSNQNPIQNLKNNAALTAIAKKTGLDPLLLTAVVFVVLIAGAIGIFIFLRQKTSQQL